MEIDKIYRIQINDGLYIEITFDGEKVLLVPEGGNIDNVEDVVTISEHAASMGGSQCFFEEGETQSVYDIIKCIQKFPE